MINTTSKCTNIDLLIKEPSDDIKKYASIFNVFRILEKSKWNEKNGIYCDKCKCQTNLSNNPHVISYSRCELPDNYIDEAYFNNFLSDEEKQKYIKCLSCNNYKIAPLYERIY